MKKFIKFSINDIIFQCSSGLTQSARIFPALTSFQIRFAKNSQGFLMTKTAATAGTFRVFLKDMYLHIKR